MVDAATSTGIQSTTFPGKLGMAFMEGWREVANMMGHISEVFQWPVEVEPQSWPTRRRVVGMLSCKEAVWEIRSTGELVSWEEGRGK